MKSYIVSQLYLLDADDYSIVCLLKVTQRGDEDGLVFGRFNRPWESGSWKFCDTETTEYDIPCTDILKKMDNAEMHDDGRRILYLLGF